ncbi:MAG: FAD-binding protein [Bacteroidetes bacterium B1(2017)]|nr:MAG: FAD-binding protein [Bacteroidetes bacterium B1(2017)]
MRKTVQLTALPQESQTTEQISVLLQRNFGFKPQELFGFTILKRSLDARRKPIVANLQIEVFLNEQPEKDTFELNLQDVSKAKEVAIVGAGPAGLFAALKLIEQGLKPVIFERGKEVKERRRDLANITRNNEVNPDSNYCFGEGGAGTYSDGKLYTRSSKRGDVMRILKILVKHGADTSILYEAHPHIGTNKLPQIITQIRENILACGGVFHFNSRVTDFKIENNSIKGVYVNSDFFPFSELILATGHSARDIYELLYKKNILIEAKPFALGVRIEHPQELIDQIQYKCSGSRSEYLPAASYSLVQQVAGRGVFSFCMCPGGIIAPAMTAPGEIVVNGWSPSKRNNPFANSGMVVSVQPEDYKAFEQHGPLAGLYFQKQVEQDCFNKGNKSLQAPAQRMADFVARKTSSTLPKNSYLPGTVSRDLHSILPRFVAGGLQEAFKQFGAKMRGYLSNEAILLATESRTSSPVRIPRNKETFEHPQIKGLYPCAEGAGYAGGIVSAAMDGENCAAAILVSK